METFNSSKENSHTAGQDRVFAVWSVGDGGDGRSALGRRRNARAVAVLACCVTPSIGSPAVGLAGSVAADGSAERTGAATDEC